PKTDDDEPTADSPPEALPELEPTPCPDCNGSRLNALARGVTVGGATLPAFLARTAADALKMVNGWTFPTDQYPVADPLVAEIRRRLEYLGRVGVDYIELDRPAATLSGGEGQRIRLASCLGSGLVGVCYVLDEPSIGLHPRDADRLLDVLEALRDQGNTVLVVEHDEAVMRRADLIVDVGPGAGVHGGRLVDVGPPERFIHGVGLTADYLAGRRRIERRRPPFATPPDHPRLTVRNAVKHNLRGLDVSIPLGRLVCVTGVSGSGKSTLVMDVLVPTVRRRLALAIRRQAIPKELEAAVEGMDGIARLVVVDQSPIGRTPRSCPASYTGLVDEVRQVFAKTKEARAKGFSASRFTFNSPAGRCPDCRGLGAQRVDLAFLPETLVPCPTCRGRRYNK
ncbi:MAG: excinuclease ABC subunit UvrA, partial [Planctomycetia bacterium]